ncbi:MAG: DUF58 domain-containing protein [Clostridia bacterium]|nr:DUF58 domain-containing protein [Clostridia bacterium]
MLFLISCAVIITVYLIYSRYFRKNALKNLEYSTKTSAHEIFEGDDFYLYENISNAKNMPLPNIRVETQLPYGLEFCLYSDGAKGKSRSMGRCSVESIFVLKPNNAVERRWRINARKRGVYYLGSVRVALSDLFGITKIYTHFDSQKSTENRITVLPRSLNIEKTFAPATDPYGDISSTFNLLSDPLIWAGAREYAPGDPINKINWKSTARLSRPMVNIEEYNEKHSYDIIFNIQSHQRENEGSMPQNSEISEMGISLCASLIDHCCTQGISVRLFSNCRSTEEGNEYFTSPEYKDRGELLAAMRMLAEMDTHISCRFERLLELLLREEKTEDNRSIILISPYIDKEIVEFSKILLSRGINISVFLTSHRTASIDMPKEVNIYYKTYK